MSESIPPDASNQAPLQLAVQPRVRRRKVFLKHKYSETITIREINKDRVNPIITKIPATFQAAMARQLIIATKTQDRMERRLDLMADSDVQMTTKEYKEYVEALEKLNAMIAGAFNQDSPAVKTNAPVNNGIIINSQGSEELGRILSRVTAKAAPPIDLPPETTKGTT